VAVASGGARAAQRDVMQQAHVVAHHHRLTHHHTRRVIHHQPAPDSGRRVDVLWMSHRAASARVNTYITVLAEG
jgi:hypothetical protein